MLLSSHQGLSGLEVSSLAFRNLPSTTVCPFRWRSMMAVRGFSSAANSSFNSLSLFLCLPPSFLFNQLRVAISSFKSKILSGEIGRSSSGSVGELIVGLASGEVFKWVASEPGPFFLLFLWIKGQSRSSPRFSLHASSSFISLSLSF